MRSVIAAAAASGSRLKSASWMSATTGDAAGLRDRFERRDEGHRRDDHFLPALEARRDQRDTQRVEAARHPDAACNAGLGGESLLEARDRRAVHERARLHQLRKVLEDLGRQRCMCPARSMKGTPTTQA